MRHKRRRVIKSSVQQSYSEAASNDLGACARNYLLKMNDDSEIADWKNHLTLEPTFVATLVEWHRNGAWDKLQKGRSNWFHLALHMNNKCHVNLKWEQYRSKFYRLEAEWKCFTWLTGMSRSTAETGLGWNADLLTFQATKEKWSALKRENKFFARFKEGRSCGIFFELSEILEGRTATGKHAQSSAQSDVHHSPWSAEKTAGACSRLKGKAKLDQPCSDFWGEDVYIPVRDDEVEFISKRHAKRPAASLGNSSHDGSRSTKSQKTGDALRDAATHISQFSQMKITANERRNEWCVAALKVWDKSYPKHEPVKLWSQKRLACMKQFEKSEQRCQMFLQSDESFQYYYADTVLDS